jgi:hypothetical protein
MLAFPKEFNVKPGSAFAVDVHSLPVPKPLTDRVRAAVGKYHTAIMYTRDIYVALNKSAGKVREIEAVRSQYTAEGIAKMFTHLRTMAGPVLQPPRRGLRRILQDVREARAVLSPDAMVTEVVLGQSAAATEALQAVQMLPPSALRQAAEQAAAAHNLPQLVAIHRHAASAPMEDKDREAALQVLGQYLAPAREALVRLEVAVNRLWAAAEAGVDEFAAYPSVPDPLRMMTRANGQDVSPALNEDGPSVLDARAILDEANAPKPIVADPLPEIEPAPAAA